MEETRYILFEKYLNNELESSEKVSFEKQLKTDDSFKQEFQIYKALESSLASTYENEVEEEALRNTLTALGATHIKEPPKKETKVIFLKRYRKLMVAASIALLIGFFIFKDGNPVYSDFSSHAPLELVVRSGNNDLFINAEKAFNTKNYEEALKQLTEISELNTGDAEIEMYIGICQLELNNYVEADAIFNALSLGTSSFATTAIWYKALSFLKQERFTECEQLLRTIPKSADEFEQAQGLLKKL